MHMMNTNFVLEVPFLMSVLRAKLFRSWAIMDAYTFHIADGSI